MQLTSDEIVVLSLALPSAVIDYNKDRMTKEQFELLKHIKARADNHSNRIAKKVTPDDIWAAVTGTAGKST